MHLSLLFFSLVAAQSGADLPSTIAKPTDIVEPAVTQTTTADMNSAISQTTGSVVAFNPYAQSKILFTSAHVPSVCKGRCLGGFNDFLEKGLGFASVVFKFTEGVVEGAVDAVYGAAEGVWSMVTEPGDFVLNIVHAGLHPEETALAIANAVSNYCTNEGSVTPESIGKCVGNAATQIGMMYVGAGEAGAASGIAKGAEVVGEEAEYASLLKNIPSCAMLRRRNIYKRGEKIPCMPPKVDAELAKTGTPPLNEEEMTKLAKTKKVKPPKVKMTPEELAAYKAQRAAEKAQKTAELEASLAAKAAEKAKKAALLLPDTVANGLPTATTFNGATIEIDYAKSFNMKHFNADRGGLGGGNTNTVIKDASQVRFGAPVAGKTGTGANQLDVLVFTSTSPVDLELFQKDATSGAFALRGVVNEPVSVSGVVSDGKVLITHFEANVVDPLTGEVKKVTNDFGGDK